MMAGQDHDVLKLLKRDHAAVIELLESYPDLTDPGDKALLVARIIVELTIHARIEEALFYPALRRARVDAALMDEAHVEHEMAKTLMRDLHGASADAPHYDAKVGVLADLIKRHIQGEEEQVFEEARLSDLDLSALGGQMDAYRAALRSRYELDTSGEDLAAYLAAGPVEDAAEHRSPARSGLNRMRRPRRASRAEMSSSAPKPGAATARRRRLATTGQRRSRRAPAGNS
jgi:hemerythrin superfamily protein